jgi:hypothetical protein
MRNPLTIVGLVVAVAWVAYAQPASASQGAAQAVGVNAMAAQECRAERRFERREFQQDYRGTNAAALRRCIREQKREARWDCREDRREDPAEYRFEYGTGSASFERCMKDELR